MGSGHDHGAGDANASALTKALVLTGSFMILEVVAGLLTGSLALISDAAHMFTDTAGLGIALAAIKIGQKPADSRRTFGYQRFEILAAALNAVLLFAVAAYVLIEGYQRLVTPHEIKAGPMLAVAFAGLIVNLISMRLLSGGKDANLNVKGAYLEVWSDMLGSIGVMIAAVMIMLTGWTSVDAIVAIGIGLWVLPRTWTLFKETINVLLEGVPEGVDLDAVAARLRALVGVRDTHDLHVWALTSGWTSLSVHLVLAEGVEGDAVRVAAQSMLADAFHITHVTIQTEQVDCRVGQNHHGLH
ncbi:MAG: cation diffusion facilitator family transporter [Hyphomicrobiaceae bacterium]|nr:cation diffusion facilitator family transporter [Hyphomicrobiaceae bacterium]